MSRYNNITEDELNDICVQQYDEGYKKGFEDGAKEFYYTRTANWIYTDINVPFDNQSVYCDHCKKTSEEATLYCPHCGYLMGI